MTLCADGGTVDAMTTTNTSTACLVTTASENAGRVAARLDPPKIVSD
jgi:hypothetical protein